MSYKILTFTVLCLFLHEFSNAQKKNLIIDHLTVDDGLSHNHIFEILQDRRGFMWFATQDGLNRYDGYTIVAYKNNADAPATISNNFILDLIEDDKGNLWFGTTSGGVNELNPVTGQITRYLNDPTNPNSLGDNAVECLCQDHYGNFWFGTRSTGLNKFEPETNTFTRFEKDVTGQLVGRITKIIEDKQNNIWFTGERGLFRTNPKTGKITQPKGAMGIISADYIYEDDEGIFWIMAWKPAGLIKYNPKTEQLSVYPSEAIGLWSCNLVDDGKQGFWISSKKGLCYFNRQTEQFSFIFQHDEINPDGLNDNYVSSIYRDRAGLLWIGTENRGINIVNFQKEQFDFYRHKSGDPNSLLQGKVSALHIDDDGILWAGYIPGSLSRIDRKSGKTTHYIPRPGDKYTLGKGANIVCIFRDSRGYLWLGGWEAGLTRFDEKTGLYKHYVPQKGDPNSLISDKLYSIKEDKNGDLWIAQRGGVSRFNPKTEQFTNYFHDANNPKSLGGKDNNYIYQDCTGTIWIGASDGVLSKFDASSETFANYPIVINTSGTLKGGDFKAIYESHNGTLWLGLTNGLYRFNKEKETFVRYTEAHGLSDNCVNGILEDNTGKLWISTLNGLSLFDPQKETFVTYDKTNGLLDNDFSESAYGKSKSGEMFFGCSKGLLAFFPGNVKNNPYIPPVVLTDFRLFGKSVPVGSGSLLQKNINETDALTLQYNQDMYSFEFAALGYTAPEKNLYAYKMEGFDKDWNYTDAKHRLATYTNLDPGKYTFRVKASNNDGVWNEKGTSLKIIILPPWWLTWWFKSLAVALIVGCSLGYYYYRIGKLKKQKKYLEYIVDLRTKEIKEKNYELLQHTEELSQMNTVLVENQHRIEKQDEELQTTNLKLAESNAAKDKFFSIIAHDLRSPFNSFLGLTELMADDLSRFTMEELHVLTVDMKKTATSLFVLLENLLQWARMQRGSILFNPESLQIYEVIEECIALTDDSAKNKIIEIAYDIPNDLKVFADSNMLQTIIRNLVSNAIKFTPRGGKISISAKAYSDNSAEISVSDTGIGMTDEMVNNLFRLDVKTNREGTDGEPSSGLGLLLCKEFVEKQGGRIWVESVVGIGTKFHFTIANK